MIPRNISSFLELCGSDPQNINGTISFNCQSSVTVFEGIYVKAEDSQHRETLQSMFTYYNRIVAFLIGVSISVMP